MTRRRWAGPVDVDLRIPAGPSAPRQARHALEEVSSTVPPAVLQDAMLMVSELVTNCVRHAGLPRGGTIGLRVALSVTTMRVEVMDEGAGFVAHPSIPSIYKSSGWGLYLVEQLADRWGVARERGNRVWFEIDLGPRPVSRQSTR
jgi:serine/threonine-protein kinase RsbW